MVIAELKSKFGNDDGEDDGDVRRHTVMTMAKMTVKLKHQSGKDDGRTGTKVKS
jgi:hypothetical protein